MTHPSSSDIHGQSPPARNIAGKTDKLSTSGEQRVKVTVYSRNQNLSKIPRVEIYEDRVEIYSLRFHAQPLIFFLFYPLQSSSRLSAPTHDQSLLSSSSQSNHEQQQQHRQQRSYSRWSLQGGVGFMSIYGRIYYCRLLVSTYVR
jgi:hypothetical protein